MDPIVSYLLSVSPTGFIHLVEASRLHESDEGVELPKSMGLAFRESESAGLTQLASAMGGTISPLLPPSFSFWRQYARRYFAALCREFSTARSTWQSPAIPDEISLTELLDIAPPMPGLEYVSVKSLSSVWTRLDDYTACHVAKARSSLAGYLKSLDPVWNLVGRVTFHLAENKKNPAAPFAFLATYTVGESESGSPQHVPLAESLRQSIEDQDSRRLDALLEPVVLASKKCPLIERMLDSRALFSPQAWGIRDAFEFLTNVPVMEEAGVIVRVPNWWNAAKPPRPQVSVRVGTEKSSLDLLDFHVGVAIEGEMLSEQELKQLLSTRESLSLLRGKWVQVDPTKLKTALNHWQQLQRAHVGGLDFLKGMRLLSGADRGDDLDDEERVSWSRVEPGAWMQETLEHLRDPKGLHQIDPAQGVQATLRPYQIDGVRWLWFATQLGLGVCLTDDMGLGKTLQVISFLVQLKRKSTTQPARNKSRSVKTSPTSSPPSLLVVPTSLLGNWQREVARFAPELRLLVAHSSVTDAQELQRLKREPTALDGYDLVATTYGLARRESWLAERQWRMIILDEAQAIKNAGASQTKAIKKISGEGRIVLTGTPVENHLGELWSLFDFCSPGLLGTSTEFKRFVSVKDEAQRNQRLASIRKLIRPYVMRRLKTDPHIVPDLPDKTEMRVNCGLTPTQAALYQTVVEEMRKSLERSDGIQRRGLVLAALMHLKQICNHAALYLRKEAFADDESGKFAELESICQVAGEKQEKILVFTQFQTMCNPLHAFLATVFGQSGLLLTGKTSAASRSKLVDQFQQESGPPYFVISLKAGGTGLNLTQACHVVHFDRWWNPAVEDQATDRAFRIGQHRNVLVHKFVCRGTLEERIDELMESKREISRQLFGKSDEINLTEMTNDELLTFVALDIKKATTQ